MHTLYNTLLLGLMKSQTGIAEKEYTQKDIDTVWSDAWQTEIEVGKVDLFGHHLFKAGYPVYKSYLPKTDFTLLEIGSGSGRYGMAIARDFPNSHVFLTDPTASSVEVIKIAQKKLLLSNITIEVADATNLQYDDESFDVIFADAVIQHIIDVKTAIQELHRVLKPGGVMILSAVNSINPPHATYKKIKKIRGQEYEYGYERTYKPAELRKLFFQAGLDDVSVDGFSIAYGLLRLKKHKKIYGRLGTYLHRVVTLVDSVTNRWLTKRYGFMLFAIGTKPPTKTN